MSQGFAFLKKFGSFHLKGIQIDTNVQVVNIKIILINAPSPCTSLGSQKRPKRGRKVSEKGNRGNYGQGRFADGVSHVTGEVRPS